MDELKNNKIFIFLFWIFILASLAHISYAIYVHRGMYCDAAFYMMTFLSDFSQGHHNFQYALDHTRIAMEIFQQIPLFAFDIIYHSKNKYLLMGIYTGTQFLMPILALLWSYYLSKRTKRIDVFFWSIFSYGAIVCTYMIFSVVESITGVILHFILWNYLVADIEYKKRDFVLVIILLILMTGTYEYVVFLGIVFFIAHFHYVFKDKNISFKSQLLKFIIGWGSLAISIFDLVYMTKVPGENGEITRFFKECYDFFPYILNLNSLFSVITIGILFLLLFKKKKIGITLTFIICCIYVFAFIHLYNTPMDSIIPMWEQHMRSVPCWAMPLIFICMYIKDLFGEIDKTKFSNYICVALICCIAQSCWQIVESYYWNKNIQYIKEELAKTDDLLYIPSEHEAVISDFIEDSLRRFIWHGVFVSTSVLFSDDYKQKTLLVNYDEQQNEGNGNYRDLLYVVPNSEKMSIPFGGYINIKTDYWDLTDCAAALDKYNKEHNIETRE